MTQFDTGDVRIGTRLAGLDSIRFVAAIWVLWSHVSVFPLRSLISDEYPLGWLINGIYNNLFSGPAAVIVFFIVSGFCIHYPFAQGKDFAIVPFYLRRYVRIAIPLIAAIFIARHLGLQFGIFEDYILWSLFAELVYYTLYPGIRLLTGRFGWNTLLGAASCLWVAVALTDPHAGNYPSFGLELNWAVGLPCWLLGCKLAETTAHDQLGKGVSFKTIWTWRMVIWALSALASVLRFHGSIGYPWTLNLFALVAYFWLAREIVWFSSRRPLRLLEWAGTWSYSLYLMHVPAERFLEQYVSIPSHGSMVEWVVKFAMVLGLCYLFYLLFEKPGHYLARVLARRARLYRVLDK